MFNPSSPLDPFSGSSRSLTPFSSGYNDPLFRYRQREQQHVGPQSLPIPRTIILDTDAVIPQLFTLPNAIDLIRMKILPRNLLSRFSIMSSSNSDKRVIRKMIHGKTSFTSQKLENAIGCMLGLAIGDSIGAPYEFTPYKKKGYKHAGFDQNATWLKEGRNRFRLKEGQWTDDTAMALCLADSLLITTESLSKKSVLEERAIELKKAFDPIDLKLRFLLWWNFGYNNAFGHDASHSNPRDSVGLGSSIHMSFEEFIHSRGTKKYTEVGDMSSSGNGSIMRLAPVPILFHKNVEHAMEIAYLQSKTTHQGEEAAECARLLAFILVKAMDHEIKLDEHEEVDEVDESNQEKLIEVHQNIMDKLNQKKTEILDSIATEFYSKLHSVTCLSKSTSEKEEHAKIRGLNLKDRNWNWKDEEFTYAKSRVKEQPGYVGSYAMDCMAMALHCVWTTNDFDKAILKSAAKGGDADTVTAVVGQIAGAIYGASLIPEKWIEKIHMWDRNGDIATKAYKLFAAGE